jgi:antitoxin component YwqK of YwqJK toxin-antitoxin module
MRTNCLFLILFQSICFAQVSLDKEIFLDSLKFETKNSDYVYSRIIQNYHTIQNEYLITDYYKSGQVEMTGKTIYRDDLVKKGLFTYNFENGNRHELVNYQNSIKLGPYFSWYENGKEKIIGEYLKNPNSEDQEGILKITQFWDANSIQRIIDGQGEFEYIEDQYTNSHGKIKDGLKDSIWNGIDKRLKITFTEDYLDGKLIFGTSSDLNGDQYHYKELIIEARPAYGAATFRKSILKKIPFNLDAKYIGKSIVLSFFIDKEGNIIDVQQHMGISPEIDAKAISLLQSAPKWFPGCTRGVKNRKRYFFPINLPSLIRKY